MIFLLHWIFANYTSWLLVGNWWLWGTEQVKVIKLPQQ
jgi:hypothetical protein